MIPLAEMSASERLKEEWHPESDSEKQLVLAQLERLLSDAHFRSSKRYPKLLRFVVEQSLAGNEDTLKERTLGVEVFGRTPDYDSNLDPVVRLSAAEVRKRIALYYQSREHQNELKIELNPGSYVPVFSRPVERVEPSRAEPAISPSPAKSAVRPVMKRVVYIVATASMAGILLVILMIYWKHPQPAVSSSVLDEVWSPLLGSNRNILICLGESDMSDASRTAAQVDQQDDDSLLKAYSDRRDFIPFPDAQTFGRLVSILGARRHAFTVQNDRSTGYSQLRENSVLLVGAFNNRWTLNRISALRFRFGGPSGPAKTIWVEDTQHPGSHEWQINSADPRSKVTKDYAIVARFTDDSTGQLVMVAAGLAGSGTRAAGEFLTDETSLQQLAVNAPSGWERKNFEAVISAQVIAGIQGKPKVVAKIFW